MFRSPTTKALVQWDIQRYTKDGRPRARRPLFGMHRKRWRERLPWPVVFLTCGSTAFLLYKVYSRASTITPTQLFLQKINIVPHGVLGTQLHPTGSLISVADSPDYNVAIVDPAGLHHIHGTYEGAGGAAGAIYNWLGLKGKFPEDVRLSINVVGDAKLGRYKLNDKNILKIPDRLRDQPLPNYDPAKEKQKEEEVNNNNNNKNKTTTTEQQQSNTSPSTTAAAAAAASTVIGMTITKDGKPHQVINPELDPSKPDPILEKLQTRNVIHAVGPDFRVGRWTDREASTALARGYRNILHEFVISDADVLRIAPLSSGIFSGPMYQQIPPLTQEALASGFEQLHQYDKEAVLDPRKKIELCIFTVREWDAYVDAFDYINPASKL